MPRQVRKQGLVEDAPGGKALNSLAMAKRARQSVKAKASAAPLVGIIMGSKSDLETMRHAADVLDELGISYEILVVSAHRTPDWLFTYAQSAEARGLKVIVAGAGGAAHLPGMAASKTVVPVLGVPVESKALKGLDSLLSIAQMPAGIPVGTLAIGKAGATNAGLLAAAIVGVEDAGVRRKLSVWRSKRTKDVMQSRELKPDVRRMRKAW